MILNLDWRPAILLRPGTNGFTYTLDRDELPDKPGLYVFGRRHGTSFEALYVGKAGKIQRRVWGQLNNNRLMNHLLEAQNGARVVVPGIFKPVQGQRIERCLPVMEHTLIRHFLDRGDDLVNKQGVRLLTHEIRSSGTHSQHGIPARMIVDR